VRRSAPSRRPSARGTATRENSRLFLVKFNIVELLLSEVRARPAQFFPRLWQPFV
jgi:hypothetical protein